eukprot:12637011-Alexandrium_andersonii.AAC.1
MSASLVGSEMCIRDRLVVGWANSVVVMSGGAEATGLEASPARCLFRSVSYTHLTLPTICSV